MIRNQILVRNQPSSDLIIESILFLSFSNIVFNNFLSIPYLSIRSFIVLTFPKVLLYSIDKYVINSFNSLCDGHFAIPPSLYRLVFKKYSIIFLTRNSLLSDTWKIFS